MKTDLVIAQLSDSHLFAEQSSLHYGVNVYQNLVKVLSHIAKNKTIDAVVFTGDLTQDHSDGSYQNFIKAIAESQLSKPLYYTAGNHDEYAQLERFLVNKPFKSAKEFTRHNWHISLLNSKSSTPAGDVDKNTLQQLATHTNSAQNQLVFMHHHPVKVGYFIDQHGLVNQQNFWQALSANTCIKAVACGHVHQGLHFSKSLANHQVEVFTCPATSIQFDPAAKGVKALTGKAGRAGYRLFNLSAQGQLISQLVYLD